jgi:hypothetical protein
MRISELIQEIVDAAEDKFGYEDDSNDGFTVEIVPHDDAEGYPWQATLLRPSARQLSYGVIEDVSTIKNYECELSFHTTGSTLLGVLKELRQKIDDADPYDYQRK